MAAASIDPLAHFLDAILRRDGRKPVPLISTRIDVTIRGGLAFVTTERTFRNIEQKPIEATMTFPVPVDATLCALTANIDGRTLTAAARARNEARQTYETAIGEGKSAILHEELLKGIHMLSVGQVRPGGQIAVTDTWTAPLSFVKDTRQLRIPTSVGEIYGRSPLPVSDDLVTGGFTHEATIGIACEDGTASLMQAGPMIGGRYHVTLDAPIDISVTGWRECRLAGVAADGRQVTLDIAPAPVVDASLDIDVLFDRSGSMNERATGYAEIDDSKFAVAKAGLMATTCDDIRPSDQMRLWEFSDQVEFLGQASGADCEALVRSIHEPGGGTEIGRAFDAAIALGKAQNVIVVTDGKSWAFDPQRLARTGMRVTAVLIGEDAIEAGIAHLAGMTGGQVFIASGADSAKAIAAALAAARLPHQPSAPLPDKPGHVELFRRGACIVATWGAAAEGQASLAARQIGATAAMLAIPLMPMDAAAKLAEAEGIVCHLTSLVLVNEAGERHEGLPATRKVGLAAPRTAPVASAQRFMSLLDSDDDVRASSRRLCEAARAPVAERHAAALRAAAAQESRRRVGRLQEEQSRRPVDLRRMADRIDWDADPEALRQGDLVGLLPDVAALIQWAAQLPAIVALAGKLGISPVALIVGLLARQARGHSRSSSRLARAVLGRASDAEIAAACGTIGL
jgi:hypothetical protein